MKKNLRISDEWEYYPTRINEKLSSNRVDLKALELEPEAKHTYYIRLPYHQDALGLPQASEMERLATQEELIEDELIAANLDLFHVGTMSSDGVLNLFYVSKVKMDFETIVGKIMTTLQIQSFVAGSFYDDHYDLYKTSLYPTIYDFNTINNRNICMQLEALGNKLETKRDTDFYFRFDTIEDGAKFMQSLEDTFSLISSDKDPNGKVIIHIGAQCITTFQNMNALTAQLIHDAQSFNGHFDGWGI